MIPRLKVTRRRRMEASYGLLVEHWWGLLLVPRLAAKTKSICIDQIAYSNLIVITSTLQSSAPSSLKIKFKMNLVDTKTTVITGKPDQDKRILRKIWSNAITTQTKLELITRLCNLNLGFKGIEDFCNLQVGELQSKNFQEKFGRIRAKNIEEDLEQRDHNPN